MVYKIDIRPLAAIEIIETYDWYELQRIGLGLEFLGELEDFYHTLLRNPDTFFKKAVRQILFTDKTHTFEKTHFSGKRHFAFHHPPDVDGLLLKILSL